MPSNVTFHGPVTGSNINIDSTLTNVKQIIESLPTADDDKKNQLEALIDQLRQELRNAPAAKKDEAAAIAKLIEDLVTKAKEQQPKPLMDLAIKNLTEAGTWVVDTLPKV